MVTKNQNASIPSNQATNRTKNNIQQRNLKFMKDAPYSQIKKKDSALWISSNRKLQRVPRSAAMSQHTNNSKNSKEDQYTELRFKLDLNATPARAIPEMDNDTTAKFDEERKQVEMFIDESSPLMEIEQDLPPQELKLQI